MSDWQWHVLLWSVGCLVGALYVSFSRDSMTPSESIEVEEFDPEDQEV